MTTMYCEGKEPLSPRRVLAIGAHPDDIDVMASGTIAAWVKDGAHVEYVVVTDGGKGSEAMAMTPEELTDIRRNEQQSAIDMLGAHKVHFLDYKDGELEVTMALKKDIVRVIRQVKPDTVITLDPTMIYSSEFGIINHPDHRAVGQATLDAIFPLSRDHLSFPDLFSEEKLEPHKVAHVLLIHFDKQDCLVDISGTLDLKLAALAQHKSQFTDIDKVGDFVKARATKLGASMHVDYAEGFVRIDLSV